MNKEAPSTTNTKKIASAKAFKFNLFDSKFNANPYPTYHRLREEDPVHKYFVGGDWIVTRYADVKAVLKSGCVRTDDRPKSIQERNKYLQDKEKNLNTLAYTTSRFLFYTNPPDHTRLRALVGKGFSPVVVERMRPHIQEIVDELLDKIRHKGSMDIVADLASPLSVSVISKLLGIPKEAQQQLHQWANVLSRILDPLVSLEEYQAMNKATEEIQEYLRTLIAEREKTPQEDLISNLIAAQEQNDRLSQKEILAVCTLLFAAGEETTGNTIGNGMLALLQHPHQMEQIKREPTMIQSAVEELIRYDSAVQMLTRIATDNLEIGNQTIKAGEKIVLCLGAANRDPAQFPEPDQLNIHRNPNHHVAFADSIHYCLGAALARVETQLAINTLMQQFPDLKLASNQLEWRHSIVLRGLKALPVTFKSSTAT
ncbi:cytochrome [Scytonema hofmannii PCC 7110]|uniref:Cytochrome n=1 Tax=Scytonema hofmannii PCC 7110 TaxID=128403 RepID=A0A139WX37_9CYAN|nr:cytochrome P450 [Scytonema hofmannii]KYC36942.1 cytochrome [Scytonema hofmannii PCC 7110]